MSWVDLLVATGEMLVVGVLIIVVGIFGVNLGFFLAEWWEDRKERCRHSR